MKVSKRRSFSFRGSLFPKGLLSLEQLVRTVNVDDQSDLAGSFIVWISPLVNYQSLSVTQVISLILKGSSPSRRQKRSADSVRLLALLPAAGKPSCRTVHVTCLLVINNVEIVDLDCKWPEGTGASHVGHPDTRKYVPRPRLAAHVFPADHA